MLIESKESDKSHETRETFETFSASPPSSTIGGGRGNFLRNQNNLRISVKSTAPSR